MDPGNSDCQPSCGWRVRAGAEEAPPERSESLLEVLPELSLLLLLCAVPSRSRPSTSPPPLLLSRVLPPSVTAREDASISWVSALVAAAPLMPPMHKAQPISQCLARMAMQLPDPQAKTRIVSETSPLCQCCLPPPVCGHSLPRAAPAGLESGDGYPDLFPFPASPLLLRCHRGRGSLMQPAQLLATLANGEPVSGARLAAQAGLTRAAIWKQIEVLRTRGVPIEARGAAGYRLPWPLQMLDAGQMRVALPTSVAAALGALEVHWELDSTSSELQRRVAHAADFSVLLAETQSAGRGRRGRAWLSPPGLNIYLSCLKRFEQGFAALAGLSLAVGVIVLRALEELGIAGAGLKWPNDVLALHDGRPGGKLGGILVELGGEYQGPCAAIIGIGLNLRLTPVLRAQAGQPACDLAELAGGTPPDRNRVAAALIEALVSGLQQFERDGFSSFAADYARHDLLRDQPLHLSGALGVVDGVGAGVDGRGALLVRLADGSVRQVDSADVSVRRV